jgi:acetylornithine deacetylase/succinyl-diaminopimelate desuccinylase-like protein
VTVIPASAKVQVDGRVIPGYSERQFLDEIQEVVGKDLRINVIEQHDGVVFPAETPLFDAIRRAIDVHDPGAVTVPYMIPGFTDSFAYARLGAVCYGFSPVKMMPGMDFTRMYHGHDERIPVEGFAWGQKVLFDVVCSFSRASAA